MTATTLHTSLRSPFPGSQAILATVTVVFETSISGGALKKVSVSFQVSAEASWSSEREGGAFG